jgi:hypothetical protein
MLESAAMSGLHRTANIWTCPCEVCEAFRYQRGVIGVSEPTETEDFDHFLARGFEKVNTSYLSAKAEFLERIANQVSVRSGRERLTFEPCD